MISNALSHDRFQLCGPRATRPHPLFDYYRNFTINARVEFFFRVEGKREEATSVRAQMIILEVISPPSVIELEFQLTLEGGLNNKSLKSKCKTVSTSDSHRM